MSTYLRTWQWTVLGVWSSPPHREVTNQRQPQSNKTLGPLIRGPRPCCVSSSTIPSYGTSSHSHEATPLTLWGGLLHTPFTWAINRETYFPDSLQGEQHLHAFFRSPTRVSQLAGNRCKVKIWRWDVWLHCYQSADLRRKVGGRQSGRWTEMVDFQKCSPVDQTTQSLTFPFQNWPSCEHWVQVIPIVSVLPTSECPSTLG